MSVQSCVLLWCIVGAIIVSWSMMVFGTHSVIFLMIPTDFLVLCVIADSLCLFLILLGVVATDVFSWFLGVRLVSVSVMRPTLFSNWANLEIWLPSVSRTGGDCLFRRSCNLLNCFLLCHCTVCLNLSVSKNYPLYCLTSHNWSLQGSPNMEGRGDPPQ